MISFSIMGLHTLRQNLTFETALEFFSRHSSSLSLSYNNQKWICIIDLAGDGRFYGDGEYANVALANALFDLVKTQESNLNMLDNEIINELQKVGNR